MTQVDEIRIGRVAPLGPVQSGIDKQPVAGPIMLTMNGFAGDEQGDRLRHGTPGKAVHHYPSEHYALWRAELGALPALRPGGFGENLVTQGMTEADVALGDRFRLGGALIEVSQGRQPCFRLNLRFALPDMARRVQATGRSGWYYRVIEQGLVAPGDRLERVARPLPDWPLIRLWRILYVDLLDREALAEMAALGPLPEGWRKYARARLDSGRVEDWSARLDGPHCGNTRDR